MKEIKRESIYCYIDTDIFRGKLEDVSKKVLAIKDNLSEAIREKYTDFELGVSISYDSIEIDLYGYREETDKEYENRLKLEVIIKEKAKQLKEKKLASEKELYEKLKKKFE